MSIGYDKKFNATRGAIRECKNAGGIPEPTEGEHFEVYKPDGEGAQWHFRLLAKDPATAPGPGYGGPHLVEVVPGKVYSGPTSDDGSSALLTEPQARDCFRNGDFTEAGEWKPGEGGDAFDVQTIDRSGPVAIIAVIPSPELIAADEERREAARSALSEARARNAEALRMVQDGAEPVMPVIVDNKANAKRLRLVREADEAMRKGQVRWLRQLLVDARFCGPSVTGFIGLAIVYAEGVKAAKKAKG